MGLPRAWRPLRAADARVSLSRIRERFSHTRDSTDAMAFGIGSTARIITGAALIVFAGFAAGDLVMFQQMGFGIAIALLIDATLVRSVLPQRCNYSASTTGTCQPGSSGCRASTSRGTQSKSPATFPAAQPK